MTPEFLISHFQLEPLTLEGGMFNLFYRHTEQVPHHALPARYTRAKALGNAIVYLHQPHTCSVLHRLLTDEIYHFYRGDPVTLLLLYPDGHSETHVLGQDYERGHEPFCVVPRDVWQGSFLNEGGAWALIGCTLAPAFDDDDFELGVRELLTAQYPQAADLIRRLTPDDIPSHLATDPRKAGAIRLQAG
jgi:uncharacterized protein